MSLALRIFLPALFLAAGYFGMRELAGVKEEVAARKKAETRKAMARRKPAAVRTRVVELRKVSRQVVVRSEGIVKAPHLTSLTPLVGGRVVRVSPLFESGGFFSKGDVLVELDRSDFEAKVAQAEARLAQAEAVVAQEEARAKQARLNWEDIGYEDEPSDLVLRKPQLKQARASLQAARADLGQARADLERTRVRAPYAGCVKGRKVGVGQSVGPGTALGEVFSTEFVEVRLPVSPGDLPFLDLPGEGKVLPVVVRDALVPGSGKEWKGEAVRTEGVIDEESRELFLVARIPDPYGREKSDGRPPLRVGQPVRAEIPGRTLEGVFEVPRSALRGPALVYVVDPGKGSLCRRKVEPVWEDEETLLVPAGEGEEGLLEGWLLATSRISHAPEGAPVEVVSEEEDKKSEPPREEPPRGKGRLHRMRM